MFKTKHLTRLIALALVLLAPSLFAEIRRGTRTPDETVTVVGPREGRVVEGVVESSSSTRLRLRAGRRVIDVQVPASVPVLWGGDRYRLRDLERGDKVRVTVDRATRTGMRARRIEVISSISERRDSRGQGRNQRFDRGSLSGRVSSINHRNATFNVQTDDGRLIVVDALGLGSRRGRALNDLAPGHRVTLRGEFIEGGAFRVESIQSNDGFDDGERMRGRRVNDDADEDRLERSRRERDGRDRNENEDDEEDNGDEDDEKNKDDEPN